MRSPRGWLMLGVVTLVVVVAAGAPATLRGAPAGSRGARERILHSTTDAYLISIDAKTGRPDPAFGRDGKVDLMEGIPRNAIRSVNYAGRRALVAGDVVVVGSHIKTATAGKEEETPPG